MKPLLWFLMGLYGVPMVLKYVTVLRDRGLNG